LIQRPRPPVAVAVALWLTISGVASAGATITTAQCDVDLGALLSDIEAIRIATLSEIDGLLADTETLAQRQVLEHMRELAWNEEEQQRGQAYYIWRDCMAATEQDQN